MAINTYLNSLDQPAKQRLAKAIISRCCQAWDVESPQEIKELKIKSNVVTNWFERGSIPWDFIITTAKETGVELDYLVFGNSKINSSSDINTVLKQFLKAASNTLYQAQEFDLIKPEHIKIIMNKLEKELERSFEYNPEIKQTGS